MRLLILAFILTACTRYTAPPQAPQVAAPACESSVKPAASCDGEWMFNGCRWSCEAPLSPGLSPRNFVCESFAAINPKAECTPEMTDAGEHHYHSARVVIDQTLIRCVINDSTASVVCAPLIYTPPTEPGKDDPAPKKGKRK